MDTTLLDNIPFTVNMDQLLRRLRLLEGSEHAEQLGQLVREAQSIARPKALYRIAFIDSRTDDGVVVDGIALSSRVLRVNLGQTHRVFPYVATCGTELEDWSDSIEDVLLSYWADAIKEMALRTALLAVEAHMNGTFQLGQTAKMNPGSLPDWPISQQRPLFRLLGEPHRSVGVKLTDTFLMLPIKSVSGIRFPTEVSFESCQLCPREVCPNRRADYDPGLRERRYSGSVG